MIRSIATIYKHSLTRGSNDILAHMTESQHGSNIPQPGSGTYDDLDTIAAEVNQLARDVLKMQEDAGNGGNTSQAEWPQLPQQSSSLSRSSTLPVPSEQEEMSAAARLQKVHEEAEKEKLEAKARPQIQQTPQQPPPSPMDFPTLGSPATSTSSKPNTPTDARRSSYADALSSGLSKKKVKPSTTPRSSLASQEAAEEGSAAVVTPKDDKATIGGQVKSLKQAPHFAQPTQSYARRAGETVRKELAISSPKPTAEIKPTQGKETDLTTEKRVTQRHNKRKSLPEDWMNEIGAGSAAKSTGHAAAQSTSAATTTQVAVQHVSPTRIPAPVTGLGIKTSASPTKATSKISQAQQSPRLQKKTSSYMSPTSATTHRTAATIGNQQPKRQSQSPRKRLPKLDTLPTMQLVTARSPEAAGAASDTSSVQFILDNPTRPAALVTSPASRSGSPVTRYIGEQQAGHTSSGFGSPRRSPTRQPRRSKMKEHFTSSAASEGQNTAQPELEADYGVFYSTPTVDNTRMRRRSSNHQILKPIIGRLVALGLARPPRIQTPLSPLRDSPFGPELSAAPPASYGSALQPARLTSPRIERHSEDRPEVLAQAPGSLLQHRSYQQQGVSEIQDQRKTAQVDATAGSLASPGIAAPPRISPYSSLRATADVFTPTQPPMMTGQPLVGPFIDYQPFQMVPQPWEQELIAFHSPEERQSIPIETKMQINRLRDFYLPQRSRYRGVPTMPQYNTLGAAGGFNNTFTSVDENGSPHVIGGTLKHNLSPGKKTVHWSLDDGNGRETPIRFGRAAVPPISSPEDSPHPTISPASDDTSPLKTPRSLPAQPWSIGSIVASSSRALPYGWTGGDGREIRFTGYGPYAERDPNSAVNFDFQGRRTSVRGSPAVSSREENESPATLGATVAPRSQKQWAQKLEGLDRVPCGKMTLTHVMEMTPFADHVAGYCYDCAGR